MIDSALLQSIAVLAMIALIWGGIVTIRRGTDRRRGVLMVVAALVLLMNLAIWAVPIGGMSR